ncbi:MAG: glycerol-3-phosphate dehydrogenase/oxidase [Chloroflexota bacterium]
MKNPTFWNNDWRQQTWSRLDKPWDVVIVGGGITGAGILREAVRSGLSTLLVEAHDFASGTSSRSSKLVHGGLRYLKNAQFRITLESVSERERLLREGRGLINRLGFLYTNMENDPFPGWVFRCGLVLYDLMAKQWSHRHYNTEDMRRLCPLLTSSNLRGGYRYFDALTDDARLVLRVIREAVRDGGTALNYARAERLLRKRDGGVCGVALTDTSPNGKGRTIEVEASMVVNAAGAWADTLRNQLGKDNRLRPLRGSHLVFPSDRIPLNRAISFLHPKDGRPVFIIPWEGVTFIGTTDVDHPEPLIQDPTISSAETEYLLTATQYVFPEQGITYDDIVSTFSGIRAVIGTGKADPSKESREHAVWEEDGLLTVTGGKLTTFRLMAQSALMAMRGKFPHAKSIDPDWPILDPISERTPATEDFPALDPTALLRLFGRYTSDTTDILASTTPEELTPIPGTPYVWAEMRWASQAEGVIHLDDLLLRRLRLGILLPRGGLDLINKIKEIAQPELGWNDQRWANEVKTYKKLLEKSYNPYI